MSNFEQCINDLAKQVHEYNAMSNDEKIKNISQYNNIIKNINQCDEQLKEHNDRLDAITSKSQKKKTTYTKKNFDSDMATIVNIKNTIETSSNLDISILMEYYETISDIQKRILPFLESKKLEIIKL
ncbi:hypothetical protein Indivirus_2_55 [Indivirus ILV1]|uniref:Uncharacterized protein n=1 Tax=Indivirus ILV1 TaxID=1977633 RepID=A0A1V0SD88_9VIRU|nr:hypothetical protein Indivirus_2_55 [Indivirus ILV1]